MPPPDSPAPLPAQPAVPTVRALLSEAHRQGLERPDAQLLLSRALKKPRMWLLTNSEKPLPQDEGLQQFKEWMKRASQGEPLAYLLGTQEFYGLALKVSPATLIPRADTETLLRWALTLIPPDAPSLVADLGTGSGALALAIRQERPSAQVTAVDLSAEALTLAKENSAALRLAIDWRQGNWWQAIRAEECFDVVVSNPPYIAEGDPHLPDLHHEPALALTSGPDGLDALRTIIAGSNAHLRPGGWLLLEHGFDQAEAVVQLLQAQGFTDICSQKDLGGRLRCTGGKK